MTARWLPGVISVIDGIIAIKVLLWNIPTLHPAYRQRVALYLIPVRMPNVESGNVPFEEALTSEDMIYDLYRSTGDASSTSISGANADMANVQNREWRGVKPKLPAEATKVASRQRNSRISESDFRALLN